MVNLKPTLKLLLNEANVLGVSEVVAEYCDNIQPTSTQLSTLLTKREFITATQRFTEDELNTAQDVIDLILNALKQ